MYLDFVAGESVVGFVDEPETVVEVAVAFCFLVSPPASTGRTLIKHINTRIIEQFVNYFN